MADEPVSALDVSIQAQILNLFMDLQQQFGTSYVFISHNLSVVEHIADDVMVMYFGGVAEFGDKATIYARPRHPYTRALMSATPALFEEDRRIKIRLQGEMPSPLNPSSGCTFHISAARMQSINAAWKNRRCVSSMDGTCHVTVPRKSGRSMPESG
ncbi:MAG: Dipeptide ABC transporter, ATP-binding protein DppF (TC 3.A.1.5.2) [Candidatus Burkholderia crenata]|nr:MAG: Dipeptide ABC transporter, ATP-binding protein DppF (TC 3.A.1.5.2) [Candidatus Burkholderia crenata]